MPLRFALVLVLGCVACSGDDDVASRDAGGADSGEELGVTPPTAPALTPCPDGWREVMDPGGLTTCEPWPGDGPESCPAGQAHFPGEPGCADVGSACPAGDFAEDLPTDRMVRYALAGATGGDGTLAMPFGTIREAAGAGVVVAVGRGSYDEAVILGFSAGLHGTCVSATEVRSSSPLESAGVITVQGNNVSVRDLTVGESERPGVWVADPRREVTIDGVVVDSARVIGMVVGLDARLIARRLVVRETRSTVAGDLGRGVLAQSGGEAELDVAIIERNSGVGVFASEAGSAVRLTRTAVRETRAARDPGSGVEALRGSSAELDRAAVEQNRSVGILNADEGSSLQISDTVIRDTDGRVDGTHGRGLEVVRGTLATGERVLIERNRGQGVLVGLAGTSVELTDAVIRDTEGRTSDGFYGNGLAVATAGAVRAERIVVANNRDIAVVAAEPDTALMLLDASIVDTREQESDGHRGRGLNVQIGASLTVERAVIARNREVGLASIVNATAELFDVAVIDTRETVCSSDGRCVDSLGMGAGAYNGGTLQMSRFAVARASLCGVQLATDGQLDLAAGVVSEAGIGACVQVPDYDLDRLRSGVVYRDNAVNLETTSLPVPEVADPLGP